MGPGLREDNDGSYESPGTFPWCRGAAGVLRSNATHAEVLEANICATHRGNAACSGVPLDILDALPVAHGPNTYIPVGMLSDPMIYIGKEGGAEQGWAWRYLPPPDPNPNNVTPIISKDGGHPGFSTYIGFNPNKKYGLVILMNTGHVLAKKAGLEIIQRTPCEGSPCSSWIDGSSTSTPHRIRLALSGAPMPAVINCS